MRAIWTEDRLDVTRRLRRAQVCRYHAAARAALPSPALRAQTGRFYVWGSESPLTALQREVACPAHWKALPAGTSAQVCRAAGSRPARALTSGPTSRDQLRKNCDEAGLPPGLRHSGILLRGAAAQERPLEILLTPGSRGTTTL